MPGQTTDVKIPESFSWWSFDLGWPFDLGYTSVGQLMFLGSRASKD